MSTRTSADMIYNGRSSTHRSGQAPGGSSQISFGPGGLGTPQRAHGDQIDEARKDSLKEKILRPPPSSHGAPATPFQNGMMPPPLTSSKRDQAWAKKRREWEQRRGKSRDPHFEQQYSQHHQQQQAPSNAAPQSMQINTSTNYNPQQQPGGPSSPLSQFVNNVDQRSNLRSGGQLGYENMQYPAMEAANQGYGGSAPRVDGYGHSSVPSIAQAPQDDSLFRQASAQLSARARSRERPTPQQGVNMGYSDNDYQYQGQQQAYSNAQYGGCPPQAPPSQGYPTQNLANGYNSYGSQQSQQIDPGGQYQQQQQFHSSEQTSHHHQHHNYSSQSHSSNYQDQSRWQGTGQNGAASVRVQAPPGGKSNILFG